MRLDDTAPAVAAVTRSTGTAVAAPMPAVLRVLERVGLDRSLVRYVLRVFVLTRLGFILLTCVTLAAIQHLPVTFGSFEAAWYRWDATFYGLVAQHGYQAGRYLDRTAFFPLYPFAIHLVTPLVGGDVALAGLVVANLCCLAALLGIAALAVDDAGGDNGLPRRAVLYLALFPTALFLFAGYPESLFIALAAWSLVSARRGAWWQAGLLGLLAALTRQIGVFLVFPFAYHYAVSVGWQMRRLRLSALWSVLPPLGPLIYMAWLWAAVGDPLAFVHVQVLWHHVAAPPWVTLLWAARQLPLEGDRTLVVRGLVDYGAVVLIAALIVVGLWRRSLRLGDALFCAAGWLLALSAPALNWPLQADGRYMLAAFPCLVVLARAGRQRWWHLVALGVFTLVLALMTTYFVRGRLII